MREAQLVPILLTSSNTANYANSGITVHSKREAQLFAILLTMLTPGIAVHSMREAQLVPILLTMLTPGSLFTLRERHS